jgi:hypothetical protein
MQTQTLTITTETMNASGENFQITTFENRISAFCDCCSNQASGTKIELQNQGWFVG